LSRSAAERYCWLRHWGTEVFDEIGHIAGLDRAADLCRDAISLVPPRSSVAGTYRGNLRVAPLSQFSRTDDGDWNRAIDEQQHIVDQFPDDMHDRRHLAPDDPMRMLTTLIAPLMTSAVWT